MKEIKLLEAQLDKLDQKGFDLEAWKQYTVVLLARIFGSDDPKISQVQKIEYDYSSWSLRDTSGKTAYLETCKKLGREIIQASIDELKTFGIPADTVVSNMAIPIEVITSALEEELKVSQMKQIQSIINSDKTAEDKRKDLLDLVNTFDTDFSQKVLAVILANDALKGKF